MWGANPGDVTLFLSNTCGSGPVVAKTLTVNAIPEPAGIITGKDTVCQGHGEYVYSIPALTGATSYDWTLPADVTISAGQGTNQVTLVIGNTAQSGNIIVKGTNNCGSGMESAKALTVKNCTGIGDNGLNSVVKIFPNPVKDELSITISGRETSLELTMTDMSGRTVYSESLKTGGKELRKLIDVSGFAKGVYFVRLTAGDRSYTEKLIVR